NSVQKLGLTPLNGTHRNGYYWQAKNYTSTDPLTDSIRNSILIDPDASTTNFNAQIAALENVYRNNFVMTPLDQAWDQVSGTPVDILFRPNYYLSGLNSSVLSIDPWITQTEGWLDYSGGAGTFDYQQ
ncbi:MAG TPA: RagB/SusD family nutrient uptake outer membrane protein, partial [Arachidicoccus soli]|nr:RagB/SusD family nutrient uptake outer membrane protein [Arachidicoccus soli]